MTSRRKIPIIPTIVVVAASAIMVMLGFWQLGKVDTQEARLAQFDASTQNPELVEFPQTTEAVNRYAYRRAKMDCIQITGEPRSVAGRSSTDRPGNVLVVNCLLSNGQSADVQLGWAPGPITTDWNGGEVEGVVEPLRTGFAKLVADPALASLEASAAPDPRSKKVGHLAYAGQWFFFALTALVIYFLAIRRRWRDEAKASGAASQQ